VNTIINIFEFIHNTEVLNLFQSLFKANSVLEYETRQAIAPKMNIVEEVRISVIKRVHSTLFQVIK
jgi:hypothetical protein